MKTLKKVGLVVLAIILLPLIIALFIPKSFTVSVTETINRPKQVVFDYMRMFNNQKNYNVWIMEDPELNVHVKGTDGSVGAIQHWSSINNNVGEGEQEITSLTPEKINLTLRFKRPMEGTATVTNNLETLAGDKTMVTTEFYTFTQYPLNLPAYLFGRKTITNAQKQNLKNLKRILETKENIRAEVK